MRALFGRFHHHGWRRSMATATKSPAALKKIEKLKDYLQTKHKYDEKTCDAIVRTFQKSGLPVNLSTARSMGQEGLTNLVESIQAQQKSVEGRTPIIVQVHVPHERHQFQVTAYEGDTMYDVASEEETVSGYLAFACGGHMACSTCHCVVDEKSFNKLEPATSAEEDMLDLAADLQPTSRLGCQIHLFDGLQVTVPENVVDHFT